MVRATSLPWTALVFPLVLLRPRSSRSLPCQSYRTASAPSGQQLEPSSTESPSATPGLAKFLAPAGAKGERRRTACAPSSSSLASSLTFSFELTDKYFGFVCSVPFHKLSQWLTYSLLDVIESILGWEIKGSSCLSHHHLPSSSPFEILIDFSSFPGPFSRSRRYDRPARVPQWFV
jgi:hypothetical protein